MPDSGSRRLTVPRAAKKEKYLYEKNSSEDSDGSHSLDLGSFMQ